MESYKEVKDSGKRQVFDTGSLRDTQQGKGRPELMSPFVLRRDAQHLANGAEKYGDRNWEKGQPVTRYWASAFRHLMSYMEGSRDEDHLAAVRWNVAAIMHTEIMVERGRLPKELIDWPDFSEK